MSAICPSCRSSIPANDVNVSTDLALCRSCGRTFRFSELVNDDGFSSLDLNSPPRGAWYESLPDGFCAGATTRSWFALFLIPFTCAWAGGSMWDIYGKQIESGHIDWTSSLFGLPFLIGSIALILLCAFMTAGRVTIRQSSDRFSIFTGVGPIGLTRNYSWSDFNSAREEILLNGTGWKGFGQGIVLEGRRKVAFGSMWSGERRYFVLRVLRSKLLSSNSATASTLMTARFR